MISPLVTQGSWRGPRLPSGGAVADRLQVVVEAVLRVLAGADLAEELAVEDLEAERDAVDAHLAQRRRSGDRSRCGGVCTPTSRPSSRLMRTM